MFVAHIVSAGAYSNGCNLAQGKSYSNIKMSLYLSGATEKEDATAKEVDAEGHENSKKLCH